MSVFCALRHSTGLNAGTPFEMASTPVIAVLPDAIACSAMNRGTPASHPLFVRTIAVAAAVPGSREPVRILTNPTPMSVKMLAMNR